MTHASMKSSFSTVACPSSDLPAALGLAAELGYDGVEIFAGMDRVTCERPADGPAIAAIATMVAFSGQSDRDAQAAQRLALLIRRSAECGCPCIALDGPTIQRKQDRAAVCGSFMDWLYPVADLAAEAGVVLAIRNAPSVSRSGELWTMLEMRPHRAIGVCWDSHSAQQAGESSVIAVPTLNSRIVHVQLRVAALRSGDRSPDAQILHRLRGIGYGGFVSHVWFAPADGTIDQCREMLREALAQSKAALAPPVVEKKPPAAKPAPAAA
jgi:sugar phosphate isomerase/epimerase